MECNLLPLSTSSTIAPFFAGLLNYFLLVLAFLFLFLSSFGSLSMVNLFRLSPYDVRLEFTFFACLSVYASQFDLDRKSVV